MSTPASPLSKFGHLHRCAFWLVFAVAVVLYLSFQAEVQFLGRARNYTAAGRSNAGPETSGGANIPANFRFIIKVLTYNRLDSLSRCLESLAAADYGGDIVKLHILIDHFPMESAQQHTAIEEKLKEAHELLLHVDGFIWPHGPKEIHYRTDNAGLQAQWLEAWWPASNDEFAFVVEDDMRLSPLFYAYLRQIVKTYYYDRSNHDPIVYGISLQRPRFVPGKHGNPLQVDNNTRLFLYQLVGTWGQLLFPRPWKEFRKWYDTQRSKDIKPLLEGMVTTGWYHRSRERIWTPWFIKFVHSRGYFNLYTNFLGEQALSVSYREKGVNTKKEAGPDSKLIGAHGLPEINIWEMKPLNKLKRYDYCFHEVLQERMITTFNELNTILPSLQVGGAVIIVNTLGFPEVLSKNWLCQFGKFGIKNYLLLAQTRTLVVEFLRRGHAVMHFNLEKSGAHAHLFEKMEKDDRKLIEGTLMIVQAIIWVLQSGYNVWFTKVDILWAADPYPHVRKFDSDMLGFASGIGISTELLYSRSSEETLQLWKDVWDVVLQQAESFKKSRMSKFNQDILEGSLGQCILKSKVKPQYLSRSLIANIGTNQTSGLRLPAPLLSGIKINDSCTISLKALGLWMLDDELSCTGIFCM